MFGGRKRRESSHDQLALINRFTLSWPESRRLVRYDPAREAMRRADRVVLASRVDAETFYRLMSR
jgi:hypothetical protein